MKRASALLSTALLVVLPAGCGGGSSKSTSTTPPATNPPIVVVDMRGKKAVEVKAGDNFFSPNGIRVDPGTMVAWKNAGSVLAAIKHAVAQKRSAVRRRGLKNPLCPMSFRARLKRVENLR